MTHGVTRQQEEIGPQIKRREAWVDLPDEYEGFQFKLWVNAPSKLWTDLTASSNKDDDASRNDNEDMRVAALRQIVLEHNGWRDFDNTPFPPASEAEFWEKIPTELAACILVAAQVEMRKLPNSIAPKKRRSRRG